MDAGSPEDAAVRHLHECIERLGTFLCPQKLYGFVLRFKVQVSCMPAEKFCRCFLVQRPQTA